MAIPLTTAAEIREMDRIAIEELGIPGVVLMEAAGRAVAEEVTRLVSDLRGYRVAVLAGAGNNGGDGYVVARYLWDRGAEVTVHLLAAEDRIRGDARVFFEVARGLGVPMVSWAEEGLPEDPVGFFAGHHCVVDALLGTGLDKEIRGRYREVIEALNVARDRKRVDAARQWRGSPDLGPFTVAVDIPSGLSADTGQSLGAVVEADLTVTFACPKIGLVTHPGAEHCGALRVADIGIPRALAARVGVRTFLLEEEDVASLVPLRPMGGHKGTFGHVLVVAGSPGKTGAAVLAARGASRVGAGLVTVAVTGDALPAVAAQSLETMCAVYAPSVPGIVPAEAVATLVDLARGKAAVVVGPGIPTTDAMMEVLRELVSFVQVPLVLDADALNLLAKRRLPLSQASSPILLTPHPGEMARLLDITVEEVQGDRLRWAREAANRFGAFVALKGSRTVIAAPGGEACLCPTGNPGMGAGGTGDVLSGVLGGLLAQGVSPLASLQLGVYLHGLAGDRVAMRLGEHGLVAGDLLEEIPGIMNGWVRPSPQ